MCQGNRNPQTTVTGDTSLTVGVHTVTVQYTCPVGYPIANSQVSFGMQEAQALIEGQTATQSSSIAARWEGGTVTVAP